VARLCERRVDGWLVVVAAHRTRERFLEEALDQMHPDKVIGLVLNGEARPLPRYAGYGEAYTSAHDDARPAPKDAS
jgi:Mrp family chromosome partitioning ATPase